MRISVVCIGSIKEQYFRDAIEEYLKRLSKFHTVDIIELKEEKMPKNYSATDIENIKIKESIAMEKALKGFVVVLDEHGESFDSVKMAERLKKIEQNFSHITFVIGGSWGISEKLKSKANLMLSFSKFTFPHQLMRVVLLEQLYRQTTIINNIPYAK